MLEVQKSLHGVVTLYIQLIVSVAQSLQKIPNLLKELKEFGIDEDLLTQNHEH